MRIYKIVIVVGGVLIMLCRVGVQSASFGAVCSEDSDCVDAHNVCVKFGSCSRGTCKCQTGYGNANNNGCDKILRSYGEQCDSQRICTGAHQVCRTGSCACDTWYTYSSLARACTLMTYKLITETCGGWWQEQCLVADDQGGQCSTYCGCKDGFTVASYISCRAPHYGERCLTTPVCEISYNTSSISDDTSNHAPVCLLNTCQCSPTDDDVYILGHHLCLSKPSTNFVRKSNGDSCTFFNECQSHLCVKCPGEITGLCMADPYSRAPSVDRRNFRVMLLMILQMFLNNQL